jgi:hypothetical protein
MKTIRITLSKEGARATCTHLYRNADWPDETIWCGDRKAFTTPDGTQPNFRDGLHQLEDTVAFQAGLCGTTHTIEDQGGLAHDVALTKPCLQGPVPFDPWHARPPWLEPWLIISG